MSTNKINWTEYTYAVLAVWLFTELVPRICALLDAATTALENFR